jgi:DHA3 family macrolide efflux protein-like MFS transporter
MIVAMPIAGVLADRHDRKKIIMLVDSLQAFATVILIILLWMGFTDIWIILLFTGLRSTFQAFHQPTVQSVVPTMVPKEKLSRVNGLNFLLSGIVQLIGPALAAILLIFMSEHEALWVDVITYLIAIVPLIFITIPVIRSQKEKAQKETSFVAEFKEGLVTLNTIPGYIVLLIMAMLLNFLIQPLGVLLSYYAYAIHDATALEYAIMSVGFQGGIIAGAILTAVKKNWKHKIAVIFGTCVIFMIGYSVLAISPYRAFFFMIITATIMGFMLPIVNTIFQTIQQTVVPQDKLGRVSSIDSTLSMFITPIGSILAGVLAEAIGVIELFFISGVLGVIVLVILYLFTGIRHVNYDGLAEKLAMAKEVVETEKFPELIE